MPFVFQRMQTYLSVSVLLLVLKMGLMLLFNVFKKSYKMFRNVMELEEVCEVPLNKHEVYASD